MIAAILQEDLEEYRSLIPYLKEEVVEAVSGSLVKLKPVIDSLLSEEVEKITENMLQAEPVLTVEATPPVVLPLEVNGLTVVEAKPRELFSREQVKGNGEWTPIRFPQYILNEGTPVFEYLSNLFSVQVNQERPFKTELNL